MTILKPARASAEQGPSRFCRSQRYIILRLLLSALSVYTKAISLKVIDLRRTIGPGIHLDVGKPRLLVSYSKGPALGLEIAPVLWPPPAVYLLSGHPQVTLSCVLVRARPSIQKRMSIAATALGTYLH